MKNLTYGIVAILLSLFVIQACTKTGVATVNGQITASKTSITVGYLDSLAVVGTTTTDSVRWSVSPTGFNSIINQGPHALIRFNKAGTYIVSAVVNGGTPVTITITATAAPVSPTDTTTHHITYLPLTGDQITLYTHLQKGPVVDSVYLWFSGMTTNNYPCGNSTLVYNNSLSSANAFSINFVNILQPATCTAIPTTIPTRTPIIFNQNTASPYMVNGTYPLTITLNSTTYTGSITVTTTTVTFNWTYTAGVLITPKTITR